MNEQPNLTHETWIYDFHEQYRPPEQPVLGVEVMGDEVFLTIATYEETNDTSTFTNKATICVDMGVLLKALAPSFAAGSVVMP